MKVFFNASLTGKKKYGAHYSGIADAIEKADHTIFAAPVLKNDPEKVQRESDDEAEEYYKRLQRWIKQSDVCVFEVSHSSLGIGHEVALALHFSKPVIALFVKGKEPHILESIPDEKLQVIEYEIEELPNLLPSAISYAIEQMDTRFNFFISPKIGNYLDWVSKNRRIPRAVYLRRLIEEDMRSNKEYGK